jgi:hypothetical protein
LIPESSAGYAEVISPGGFGEKDIQMIQGTVKPFNQGRPKDLEDEFDTSF